MSAAQYAREALERAEKATPLVRSGLDFGWVEYTADGPFLDGPAVTTTRLDGADADFIEGAVRDVPKLARAVLAVLDLCDKADEERTEYNLGAAPIRSDAVRRALSDALEVEA